MYDAHHRRWRAHRVSASARSIAFDRALAIDDALATLMANRAPEATTVPFLPWKHLTQGPPTECVRNALPSDSCAQPVPQSCDQRRTKTGCYLPCRCKNRSFSQSQGNARGRGARSVVDSGAMQLPSTDVRRALVSAYAQVSERLSLLEGSRPLVLPNGEFFPDVFTADEASVQRLLDRMLEHAGLSDMAVVAKFWSEDEDDARCGTGACGSCGPAHAERQSIERLVDAGEFWQVNVLPGEAKQPIALSSALCRAVALAVLREADSPPTNMELDLAVDLTAVALGFGMLVLEGSHIYRKSCGGPSIARVTALGPTELALAVALSAAVQGQSLRKVSKYLSPTQQEAFAEAKAWADSNASLSALLRASPERVANGEFELKEPSSWLGRWLGGKARRAPTPDRASTIEELEAALQGSVAPQIAPKARDPQFEEIRRLVDEALSE